jgi:hypothetical protein
MPGGNWTLSAAQPAQAQRLTGGPGAQPGPQPVRLRERAEVLGQQQPGDLAHLSRVRKAEVVLRATVHTIAP